MENENLFVGRQGRGSDSAVKVVGRLRNSRLGWTVTGTLSRRGRRWRAVCDTYCMDCVGVTLYWNVKSAHDWNLKRDSGTRGNYYYCYYYWNQSSTEGLG